MSRVAGTVFAAAALSSIAVPGARALTTENAPQVQPASTGMPAPRHAAPAAPRQAAAVATSGEWWRDDCDHYEGHCHRRLHDVRCHYKYHRRECEGWDGDRPWRSYDEWWHESPDHEGLGWSDGPGEHWRDLGDGHGGDGWRWQEDRGEHRSADRGDGESARVSDGNHAADRGAVEVPSTGNGDANPPADRGAADGPGSGSDERRSADRSGAPINPGTGGGLASDQPTTDQPTTGQGRVTDPGAGTPATGRGSTPTAG